ncbi:MAG: EamA/RhaT family transporter, partial [Alphaproteobacteria bacterium]
MWSSGFIAAKIGLGHADTLTFLGLRYGVVTLLMGGVWLAMGLGVGAGVTALIVCMQPILTAAV